MDQMASMTKRTNDPGYLDGDGSLLPVHRTWSFVRVHGRLLRPCSGDAGLCSPQHPLALVLHLGAGRTGKQSTRWRSIYEVPAEG